MPVERVIAEALGPLSFSAGGYIVVVTVEGEPQSHTYRVDAGPRAHEAAQASLDRFSQSRSVNRPITATVINLASGQAFAFKATRRIEYVVERVA